MSKKSIGIILAVLLLFNMFFDIPKVIASDWDSVEIITNQITGDIGEEIELQKEIKLTFRNQVLNLYEFSDIFYKEKPYEESEDFAIPFDIENKAILDQTKITTNGKIYYTFGKRGITYISVYGANKKIKVISGSSIKKIEILEDDEYELDVGVRKGLACQLIYEDNSKESLTKSKDVNWTSTNEDVIEIEWDGNGYDAIALSPGKSIITAEYEGLVDSFTIIVPSEIEDPEISWFLGTDHKGKGITITYNENSNNHMYKIGDSSSWQTLNKKTAYIENNGDYNYDLNEVIDDNYTIYAKCTSKFDKSVWSRVVSYNVDWVKLEDLDSQPKDITINVGEEAFIYSTAEYSLGDDDETIEKDVSELVTIQAPTNLYIDIIGNKIIGKRTGSTNLTAYYTYNGKTKHSNIKVKVVGQELGKIEISPNSLIINEGQKKNIYDEITVTAYYIDGSSKDVTDYISIGNYDSDIININSTGLITVLETNEDKTTMITINYEDNGINMSNGINLKVMNIPELITKEPKSIELNKAIITLIEGENETLHAAVGPYDATDKSITWMSADSSIATVDSSGRVKGVKKGTTTITAKTVNNIVAECSIKVEEETIPIPKPDIKEPESIELNKDEITLYEGDSEILQATVSPDDSTDKSVTWTSDDPNIASVSISGKVVGKEKGTTTIAAETVNGKKAFCIITVKKKSVASSISQPISRPVNQTSTIQPESIYLNKDQTTLSVGESETLQATVNPSDATDKSVTWSSTNTDIVTVNQSGKVTGIKKGVAQIKVIVKNNLYDACTVTVNNSLFSINGCIVDEEGNGISDAEVYLNDNFRYTDSNGDFYIDEIEEGVYKLIVDKYGYESYIDDTYKVTKDIDNLSIKLQSLKTIKIDSRAYLSEKKETIPSSTRNLFRDVTSDKWYYDYINRVASNGIVRGYEDGTFRPENKLKVNEFIAMIVSLKYRDIKTDSNDWAKGFIDKALELGYFDRSDFNSYTREITRAEMCKLIIRSLKVNFPITYKIYANNISDYKDISEKYKEYVLKCYYLGVINGYSDGSFKPNNPLKRCEACSIIDNMFVKCKPSVSNSYFDRSIRTQFTDGVFNLKGTISSDVNNIYGIQYSYFGNIIFKKDFYFPVSYVNLEDFKLGIIGYPFYEEGYYPLEINVLYGNGPNNLNIGKAERSYEIIIEKVDFEDSFLFIGKTFWVGADYLVNRPKEAASIAISLTPADILYDGTNFVIGKDIVTGEEVDRGILLICLITPELAEQAFKKGTKVLKVNQNAIDFVDGDVSKIVTEGTGKLAKYGDEFGSMGKYVKNPNIKLDWDSVTQHGMDRMVQRGVSKDMVNNWVKNGKTLLQDNGNKFAFVTKEGVAVVDKTGKLITAWTKETYDESMKKIVEALFGK